jgi:hypothetical protein
MVKYPNFLIVGAPKAGTTSIAAYLNEHPEVFISEEKEPFYFISDVIKNMSKEDPMYDVIMKKARLNWDDYFKLFSYATDKERLRGEATVHYLYHYDTVIPEVKKKLGDVPIIIILRNPVSRAFSNYSYQSRGQLVSFEQALELEEKRKEKGFNSFWFYKGTGEYCEPVTSYLENFSKVYIGLFEDFKCDPISFMQSIYRFLEVNESITPEVTERHNQTLVPKNKFFQVIYFLKQRHKYISNVFPASLKRSIRKKVFVSNKQKINAATEKMLKDYFRKDIQDLEKVIQRNLTSWYI